MQQRNRDRLEALAAGVGTSYEPDNSVRNQSDRDVKEATSRVRGVFNGTNKKLDVITKLDGYCLRWFNDTPGRIELAQSGGWEFVSNGEVAQGYSHKVLNSNSDVGNKIRAIVGVMDTNQPLYAYLMKIRKEWFDEDQMDSVNKRNKIEADMIRNGGLNTDRIGEKYLPDGRKAALVRRDGEFTRGVN
jgi:hypothetical protein